MLLMDAMVTGGGHMATIKARMFVILVRRSKEHMHTFVFFEIGFGSINVVVVTFLHRSGRQMFKYPIRYTIASIVRKYKIGIGTNVIHAGKTVTHYLRYTLRSEYK